MTRSIDDGPRRRLGVFSHPNHELAILGCVSRLRPTLVFLTDGGGRRRTDETRRVLERLGVLDQARFLGHTEAALYEALLAVDVGLFRELADEVAAALDAVSPDVVFCDAVEFYNPVHDITRPLVASALAGRPGPELYEVPLVHQLPGDGERYAFQRAPASHRGARRSLRLTAAETDAKVAALRDDYHCLREQMHPLLTDLPRDLLAREELVAAEARLPEPGPQARLRYEWRGRRLQEQGRIGEVITWADHYRPLAAALMGHSSARR